MIFAVNKMAFDIVYRYLEISALFNYKPIYFLGMRSEAIKLTRKKIKTY